MTNKVRLGIVGFGRMVELVHLPLIKKLPEMEVAGIFDVTAQRLELASRRGFPVYESLPALLSGEIDAVLIATPPSSHYAIALEALHQGKHVIVEKPVTLDGGEAKALQALARQVGRTVTVFHNRRFDRDYLLVKRMLAEKALGPILFVNRSIHRFGSGASFGVKSFHAEWRDEIQFGGGALLDWGVHLVDQLLELRLGECAAVRAQMRQLPWMRGEVEDYVQASFALQNGILLSMDINFGSNAPAPAWIVGGENATLYVASEKEACILEKGKPARSLEQDAFPKKGAECIYTSFAGCILRREPLEISMEQAVRTMEILDWIRESAGQGKEIRHGDSVFGSASGI